MVTLTSYVKSKFSPQVSRTPTLLNALEFGVNRLSERWKGQMFWDGLSSTEESLLLKV